MQGDFERASFYTFRVVGRHHEGMVVMALVELTARETGAFS